MPGVAQAGDGFGTTVAVGFFGDDGNALAVGVPGEDVGTAPDAGLVDVLYNSDTGLAGGARQQLTQADAAGAVEPGDRFGAALSGPILHESDVLADLGIGATGERVGGAAGAGAVSILFGSGPTAWAAPAASSSTRAPAASPAPPNKATGSPPPSPPPSADPEDAPQALGPAASSTPWVASRRPPIRCWGVVARFSPDRTVGGVGRYAATVAGRPMRVR